MRLPEDTHVFLRLSVVSIIVLRYDMGIADLVFGLGTRKSTARSSLIWLRRTFIDHLFFSFVVDLYFRHLAEIKSAVLGYNCCCGAFCLCWVLKYV